MKSIKRMAEILERNVEEARAYIDAAYHDAETNKPLATWERDMALAHLKFNDAGHTIAAKEIQEQSNANADDERIAGMMDVWQDKHARIVEESNAVKYLIDKWA